MEDQQELSPEAPPPGPVSPQRGRDGRREGSQPGVERQEEKLEKDGRDEGVERVQIAETQERKKLANPVNAEMKTDC